MVCDEGIASDPGVAGYAGIAANPDAAHGTLGSSLKYGFEYVNGAGILDSRIVTHDSIAEDTAVAVDTSRIKNLRMA
ncbi:hypothetical protein AYX22_17930 [Arthrobacter sp. D5-1]|nr:hypothetical protein AYX22_17930 [Arthrobacter sp. D5-1]